MDEALDFSVKKRCLSISAPLKNGSGAKTVKEEHLGKNGSHPQGRFTSSPVASSSSSQSSQSPTSTSHHPNNNPMPFSSMFRAMGWDPTGAGPFGLFGGNPLTPLPISPSGMPGFFPQSFVGGSGTTPDSSMYPTASLAMSTLQRRRRSVASAGSEDQDCGSKKTKSIPDEKKDDAYWERRRKNNEAAKRSRDTRRNKEEEIAVRAAYLEQENLKLRAQVAILKNETAKLHFMLFNHVQSPTA